MTILARRRVVVTGLERQAVDAGVKTFRLPRMARRTVHPRHCLVVVGMLVRNVGVTVDAGIRRVRRGHELRLVHEQRDRFAGRIGLGQRVVAVTIEAVAVFQTGRCRHFPREQKQQC